MNEKILVVDDERDICEILSFNLENEGYEVTTAYSAEEALDRLRSDHALMLLDVMMGGMSGFRLAERLRKAGHRIPIIFLTAKDSENDMLTGFSVGADDYIAKPFSLKEVTARVKAVLRRSAAQVSPAEAQVSLRFGDLEVCPAHKDARWKGRPLGLTKTEFELLFLLASHPGRLYARDEIIRRIWKDSPYITERTVDVHLARLRKKMGPAAPFLSSKAGYGYRFTPELL